MKQRRINEIKATLLTALGLLIFASLISFTPEDLPFYTSSPNVVPQNLIRGFGAYLAGILLFSIGWSSWLLVLFIFFWSASLFKQKELDFRFIRVFGAVVLILSASSLFAMIGNRSGQMQFSYGGLTGLIFSSFAINYFGKLGAFIIFSTLSLLSLVLVFDISLSSLFMKSAAGLRRFITKPFFKPRPPVFSFRKKTGASPDPVKLAAAIKPQAPKIGGKPKISVLKPEPSRQYPEKTAIEKQRPAEKTAIPDVRVGLKEYCLPGLDLLDVPAPLQERKIKEDLSGSARILEETLSDFGISVKVTNIECGPVITRYELEPAPGVKLNRIVSLADDIALSLKAQSARVVAPIPGKGRVGVEIPNVQSSFVCLREVLSSQEFQQSTSQLPLSLGKDITGKPIVADLSQMPHLLIAGTTGSGKTVCVNSLILSLLFSSNPDEVKFIMIDPKMVELAPFNEIPHLLCPVVTEAKKAALALTWLLGEMEERYQLFAREGKRNIEAYNKSKEKIPYIVVIIDELADLMAVAQDEVEGAITRLAHLSRAVGIHLVLVTQRPSVDVITGVIKANFPARISFQVASKVDSRTVLDTNGADKLLGRGDMLFLNPGEAKLIRAQGNLVTDREIERVVNFIKSQAVPVYDEQILKEQQRSATSEIQQDTFFNTAVQLIMETGQASVSILQRRLRLGYTRAARIIDAMEEQGFIGHFEGSKPRRILVDREQWLKQNTLLKAEAGLEKEE